MQNLDAGSSVLVQSLEPHTLAELVADSGRVRARVAITLSLIESIRAALAERQAKDAPANEGGIGGDERPLCSDGVERLPTWICAVAIQHARGLLRRAYPSRPASAERLGRVEGRRTLSARRRDAGRSAELLSG